jgi:PelA/Pel-15E family pectate lyase
MMRRTDWLLVTIWLAASVSAAAATAVPNAERARQAMRKAGNYWATTVASQGGYVWEYTTDFVTRRRGESGNLPLTTNWVQPPGTPSVGMAFLRAYEATGESGYLDAAVAAAHCLAWGQLASGGWTYSIEFDSTRNRNRYHHLDPRNVPRYNKLRNVTTFDDNTTQSATRLLMAVDQYVDDPIVDAAIQRALECFLTAQYKDGPWDGAWPQRYPPPKGYGAYPTFNDDTINDCVRVMLVAAKQYGDPRYMDSVKRCIEFYLRSQLPAPQAAWAQQYDENLKPAWARKFEPPAVTGSESSGNMQLLMDMYIEFGDRRYLDAVGGAIDWYKRSRIGGTEDEGIWARFYEPGTNKPLYFTRTYKLVYTDDDLPVHYSFKSNYGVNSRIRYYQQINELGRDYYLTQRDHVNTPAEWVAIAKGKSRAVKQIIKAQDDLGRWVKVVAKREQVRDKQGRVRYEVDEATKLRMMYSRKFIRNIEELAAYITAVQGGPKVSPTGRIDRHDSGGDTQ